MPPVSTSSEVPPVGLAAPPPSDSQAAGAVSPIATSPVPPPVADPSTTPIDLQVRLARSLFNQGLTAYSAGDFKEAARWWGLAHDMMAGKPELVDARHVLALDLGHAELKAYEKDHLPIHLVSARTRVEEYLTWIQRPEHLLTGDEREDQSRAFEMLTRIAALSASSPTTLEPASIVPNAPPTPGDRLQGDLARRAKSAKRLIISGSVFTTAAIMSAIATIVFGTRYQGPQSYSSPEMPAFQPPQDSEDEQMRAALVATTVFATIGVPMLTVGLVRRKNVRRQLELTPMAGGFVFHGRF